MTSDALVTYVIIHFPLSSFSDNERDYATLPSVCLSVCLSVFLSLSFLSLSLSLSVCVFECVQSDLTSMYIFFCISFIICIT